jgi:hypothetical protein
MTEKVLLSFTKFALWQNISSGARTASTAAWTMDIAQSKYHSKVTDRLFICKLSLFHS